MSPKSSEFVRSYFNKLDDLEPVTRKQLRKMIREGAVTVLDVRPPDEFALGHVPGAVNIPLRALKGPACRNQSRPGHRRLLPRRILRAVL